MSTDLTPTSAEFALLTEVDRSLVWRNDRDGRAYRGSGKPGQKPPDITEAVDAMVDDGWIEKRSPTSAVYHLTEAGKEALRRG